MDNRLTHIRTSDGLRMLCGLSLEDAWRQDRESASICLEWGAKPSDRLHLIATSYSRADAATCPGCRKTFLSLG